MLGRLTGNVWVEDNRGERLDIGLAVNECRTGPVCAGWVPRYNGAAADDDV